MLNGKGKIEVITVVVLGWYFLLLITSYFYLDSFLSWVSNNVHDENVLGIIGQIIFYGYLYTALSPMIPFFYYYDNRGEIQKKLNKNELKTRAMYIFALNLFGAIPFYIIGLEIWDYFIVRREALLLIILFHGIPILVGALTFHLLIGIHSEKTLRAYVFSTYPALAYLLGILQRAKIYIGEGVYTLGLIGIIALTGILTVLVFYYNIFRICIVGNAETSSM